MIEIMITQPRSQGLSSYRAKMRDPGNEVDDNLGLVMSLQQGLH